MRLDGRTDVYPVGVLHTLRTIWRGLTVRELRGKRWGIVRQAVRSQWRYLWGYCIRQRKWRALRNSFNGYLAEHEHGGHNAGRGWTKRAALRRVDRICEQWIAETTIRTLAGTEETR